MTDQVMTHQEGDTTICASVPGVQTQWLPLHPRTVSAAQREAVQADTPVGARSQHGQKSQVVMATVSHYPGAPGLVETNVVFVPDAGGLKHTAHLARGYLHQQRQVRKTQELVVVKRRGLVS